GSTCTGRPYAPDARWVMSPRTATTWPRSASGPGMRPAGSKGASPRSPETEPGRALRCRDDRGEPMSRAADPLVGIEMGSDSDWPTMSEAAAALEEFGVPFEADVVSAHRMPNEMLAYGAAAHGRGLKVLVAGAGGAAHLPGMLAAVTPLPVIGVPVALRYLD